MKTQFKLIRRLMLPGVIAVGMATSSAQATTLLASNLETPTYSIGSLVGQDGWANEGGGANFNVIANTVPGFGVAGSQTLEMSGGAGSGYVIKTLSSVITNGVWYFDFDIFPNSSKITEVLLDNAAGGSGTYLSFDSSGKIYYWDNASFVNSGISFSNGLYHVTEKLDIAAGTYDIYMNSNPTPFASNLIIRQVGSPIGDSPYNPIYAVELLTLDGANTDKSYLDNMLVSDVAPAFLAAVPEPASAALLCMGGSIIWLRRKRS